MRTVRVHVQDGRLVLDGPVSLPRAAAVEVSIPEHHPLTDEDHEDLDTALDESAAQFARGEIEDAHAFACRLVTRS